MFVVEKVARGHRYLYLAETYRENGKVRQRLIRPLGRKDQLLLSGDLDRLIASTAQHSDRNLVLSEIDNGELASTRIGGPLLFGRLWERLGIGDVLRDQLAKRAFDPT